MAATAVRLSMAAPPPPRRSGSATSMPVPRRARRGRLARTLRSFAAARAGVPESRGLVDMLEWSRDFVIHRDGGPPRWFTPLECGPPAASAPLLLYLPGIDGTGLGLLRHHKRMGMIFDIWCLHIPIMHRMPFEGLLEFVENTVKLECTYFPRRPIYLIGESLGACLALAIAARNPDVDFVLILANPATSFSKSPLQLFLSLLDFFPRQLQDNAAHLFDFITGNSTVLLLRFVQNWLLSQDVSKGLSDSFSEMLPYLSFLAEISPADSTLRKLKMLRCSSLLVNSLLGSIKAQVLILVSGRDQFFPSYEESERLCKALPNSRVRHFKDHSHALFLEDGMDLVTTIKGAGYYRRSKQVDHVFDFLMPTPCELQQILELPRLLEAVLNPVMFSTLESGAIVKGLAGIPSEGPAVLVGYHMLLGWELGPLVSRFLSDRNILLRGIAHPFIFERITERLMPDSSSFDHYRVMGAVPVSSNNLYKLLSTKSFVLLYPGGAREALHRKGEQYTLFWPEQAEFVRMASIFGASIIPFGVVGEDDICKMLLDYDDLLKIPFYDVVHKIVNPDVVKFRADSIGEVGKQELYMPALFPKFPGRIYFLFGRPIETKGRREELRDKKIAQEVYMHAKGEVEKCISFLIKKREEDPYRNLLWRLLYQASRGFTAEVPTFEV